MAIWVEVDLCDGCRRCVRACPYDAVEIRDGKAHIGDRCTSCGACMEACRNEAILTDAQPRVVPDFSDYKGVWVFGEQRGGELHRVSVELLGKAQELATQLNQTVAAVLIGDGVAGLADTLVEFGADTVYLVEDAILRDYRTEAYALVGDMVMHLETTLPVEIDLKQFESVFVNAVNRFVQAK